MEKRRAAMLDMPRLIRQWKRVGSTSLSSYCPRLTSVLTSIDRWARGTGPSSRNKRHAKYEEDRAAGCSCTITNMYEHSLAFFNQYYFSNASVACSSQRCTSISPGLGERLMGVVCGEKFPSMMAVCYSEKHGKTGQLDNSRSFS